MVPIAHPLLGVEEREAVLCVLASGQVAQGEQVTAFENRFAEIYQVREAVPRTRAMQPFYQEYIDTFRSSDATEIIDGKRLSGDVCLSATEKGIAYALSLPVYPVLSEEGLSMSKWEILEQDT